MAGSKKYFVYTSNLLNGYQFAIVQDESNAEAVNGSGYDYTDALSLDRSSRGVKPREVSYVGKDSTGASVTRSVVWFDPATFNTAGTLMNGVLFPSYLPDGNVEQVLCKVTKIVGESLFIGAIAADSGILDGDED